jgi:hypothetical protein
MTRRICAQFESPTKVQKIWELIAGSHVCYKRTEISARESGDKLEAPGGTGDVITIKGRRVQMTLCNFFYFRHKRDDQ